MGVNGIYGLSGSGMDIESMVKVGMMSKQNEYDKMAQKFTKNEWMKADYLEINSKITTFNASTLSQYKMSTTMNAKSAESSNAAVKVSAGSNAAIMSHQVEVTSLSSNAYLVGTNKMDRYGIVGKLDDGSADTTSIKLADVLFSALRQHDDGTISGAVAKVDEDLTKTGTNTYRSATDDKSLTDEFRFGRENYRDYENITQGSSLTGWEKKNSSGTWVDSSGPQHGTISGMYDGDYTLDTSVWRQRIINEKIDGNGNWSEATPGSGDYTYGGGLNSDWRTRTIYEKNDGNNNWSEATPTHNDFNVLKNPGDWRQYTIRERDNAAVNSSSNQDSQIAFKFEIYDGTETEAMAGMSPDEKEAYKKAHTISYTFADLLGTDTTEAKTFYDLVSEINAMSDLNVKATYDAEHDTFSFYNSKGGTDNTINIVLDADVTKENNRYAVTTRNFFDNMGLYQSANGKLTGETGTAGAASVGDKNSLLFEINSSNSYKGSTGSIKIDGVSYDTTDNKATVGGITYTALNTTLNTDSSGNVISSNPATISVTQDTDSIMDKVKSFVTDYNKLLSELYAKYDEKPNSDYKPLTQSQKDQMKEEQITKWEEKAKAGMLYHDQTLGKIIQTMRDAVSESVDGISSKYNSIYSLGISTTGIKGQLVLDEDKLKKALADDPDAVYNVFAKLESTTTDSASAVYKTQTNTDGSVTVLSQSNGNGIAQRLSDIFVNANKLIKDRAGSSSDITEDSDLNSLLRNLQTKMSNFKKLMNSFEDALYKKYDAMESTLAKLGMQLNYVMGSSGQ